MSVEIVMPRLSDTMDKGTVARWNKQSGEAVKRGDVLLEIETDKANMELESYADGILARIMVKEGETAPVGAPIGIVAADETELQQLESDSQSAVSGSGATKVESSASSQSKAPEAKSPPSEKATASARTGDATGRIKASPLAKRMASERGIDLSNVVGTGPGGRITRDDVEAFSAEASPSGSQATGTSEAPESRASVSRGAGDEEIELSRMQRTVGRRLTESVVTAPHFYVTSEIDMSHAVRFRQQINDAEPELKVSFNDLIVKACGTVLARFPNINASWADGKIIRHGSVNVGIAVDLPDGLIVPVLKDVDTKGLREVTLETKQLVARAREGKGRPEDFEGGTFTVSNLGMHGIDQFTAIINPPESAILAVGAIIKKPVVIDGEVVVRDRMRVTLSSDHRVIYGAAAAEFLGELRRTLEHPVLIVI